MSMPARLEVGKVVLGAFLVPWWNRQSFVRALAIPLFAIVALNLSWYYAREYLSSLSTWLLTFVWCALFVLFAVTCHRLVLLDPRSISAQLRPHWSWRETRFFVWLVIVYILVAGALLVASALMLNIVQWTIKPLPENQMGWPMYAAALPALYIFARLCLVFPATAVDRRVTLRWAWRLSERNGWRLFLVVAVLPWFLSYLVTLLYRDNASVIETVAITAIGVAVLAFEIAALSLSYRELTREEARGRS